MCFGSKPPQDNSAEQARIDEQARQARIREGQGGIDTAFSKFDDGYYDNYKQDYLGYYRPQLQDQAAEARKKVIFNLSRSGNLDSSAGADALADFEKERGIKEGQVGASALDAVNSFRQSVNQNKTDLYNINRSAADPSSAAAQAATRAADLSAPVNYSPLGDVFASLLNSFGQQAALEARGYPGLQTGLFNSSTSSRGSSRTVN